MGLIRIMGPNTWKPVRHWNQPFSELEKYRDFSPMPLIANSYEEELLTARSAYDIVFFTWICKVVDQSLIFREMHSVPSHP